MLNTAKGSFNTPCAVMSAGAHTASRVGLSNGSTAADIYGCVEERFPILRPFWHDLPWLVGFTVCARHDDVGEQLADVELSFDGTGTRASASLTPVYDFAAGVGEAERTELEKYLAPMQTIWLALEHKAHIVCVGVDADSECSRVADAAAKAEGTRAAGADVTTAVATDSECSRVADAAADSERSRVACEAADSECSPPPVTDATATRSPIADAAILCEPNTAAAFTTADCLPIVLASETRPLAAAVHAGWRSLAAGIIESTIAELCAQDDILPGSLRAWIGPAVSGEDYEVNDEVRDLLLVRPAITADCFTPTSAGHCLADLPKAAAAILAHAGVSPKNITRCTLSTKKDHRLHSVRRDGERAGRMATVVGICAAGSDAATAMCGGGGEKHPLRQGKFTEANADDKN